MHNSTAVILVNLGTPLNVHLKAVRSFLAEFLMDAYVIQVPWIARAILVYGLIVPFRSRSTQAAYATIWKAKTGSPLSHHSHNLTHALSDYLNDIYPNEYHVELAMRYAGGPLALGPVLQRLQKRQFKKVILLPLYPQYAESTTQSTIELFLKELKKTNIKSHHIIKDFYDHPSFISSVSSLIQKTLDKVLVKPYILFSFHGLPQDHVKKTGCDNCPSYQVCPSVSHSNRMCYRAQCFATAQGVAHRLGLSPSMYGVSFQSRLGRRPWIGPYTDKIIHTLANEGIQHLAVVSPSFVTDCLETEEEINIRLRESWFKLIPPELGGAFSYIPCVNDHSQWVAGIAQIIHNT